MDIPVELQAFVLTKLDGASLARAKRVCTLWNDAVRKLEVFGNVWMGCCLRETSPEILAQLSGVHDLWEVNQAVDHRLAAITRDLPWTFWRDLYAKVHRAGYVRGCCSWQFKSIALPPADSVPATCLTLWGNTLLLGYRNGYVSMCEDIEQISPEFSPLHLHGREVTELRVVKPSYKESCPVVVSVSGGHDIQVIGLDKETHCQLNYHSKAINCASAWNDRFVTGAGDTMLLGQAVWRVERPGQVSRELVLREHLSERITCTAMWAHQVASGDCKGNVLLWHLAHPDKPTHVGCFNSAIKWIELRGKLLLWLTASGVLYISTDCKTYRSVEVFRCLLKKPEAVALWGPLFAVGTRAGFVHLYHVARLTDWEELDLGSPQSVIKFEADHINSLDLGDNCAGPVIAVATDVAITLVRWRTISGQQSGQSSRDTKDEKHPSVAELGLSDVS